MNVVCDTNVFLSAIIFGGNPDRIIQAAVNKEIKIITSPTILLECAKALKRKFQWNSEQITTVVKYLGSLCTVVRPTIRIHRIRQDPSDNRILECALEARVDYIISGDKRHILSLGKFRAIPILSAAEFLSTILYKKP